MKQRAHAGFICNLSDYGFIKGRWRTPNEYIDVGAAWIIVARNDDDHRMMYYSSEKCLYDVEFLS